MKKLSLALVCLGLAVSAAAQTANFDGHTWWDYIKVIADDKMEGRDTGSRGERAAQEYVVEQLKKAGLEPAGIWRNPPPRTLATRLRSTIRRFTT